jgi:hypothetical protein
LSASSNPFLCHSARTGRQQYYQHPPKYSPCRCRWQLKCASFLDSIGGLHYFERS